MKASRELAAEAQELFRLGNLTLKSLDEGKVAKLIRDPSGKIVGIKISGGASLRGGSELRADGEVTGGETRRCLVVFASAYESGAR